MKYAHTIILTVFVKPEDIILDESINKKINECIRKMLVIDYDKEQVLKITEAGGFENRKIIIYELSIHKESHTNQFISNLMKSLTIEQKQYLISDKHERLDEELGFYLRLDKKALLEGKTKEEKKRNRKIKKRDFTKQRNCLLSLSLSLSLENTG